MTKIKICGLRRMEDVHYVNLCKPDYVGFVFAPSKRMVTTEQAVYLRNCLLPEIIPVGVFVNALAEEIAQLLNDGVITVAQLHGDEDEMYIQKLRNKMQRGEIIKAIRIKSEEDIRSGEHFDVDYLLFDTFSGTEYGGTGQTFNWKLINYVKKPFFLAGGMSSQNVEEAIKMMQPYGVDVSSAVETSGRKDKDKIAEFVERVRQINHVDR